jgi:hypothetical protein
MLHIGTIARMDWGEPVYDARPLTKRSRDRVADSISELTGYARNEDVGLFITGALLATTGLIDYAISKTASPSLPMPLGANGTMALVILGVFLVVCRASSVGLGKDEGRGDIEP